MSLLPGYRAIDMIHESESSIVYRAARDADDRQFAVKLLNEAYPTPTRIRQFQHEFQVGRLLEAALPSASEQRGTFWSDRTTDQPVAGDVARSHELIEHMRRYFLVMEYCAGEPLSALLKQGPLPLDEALAIGIQLADVLGRVHQAGVIHKDVNPSNLIYDRSSGRLRLIDFGIASLMAREATTFYGSSGLVGTPAYLSPEQTGRMNRSIDYRSDFYSFGVTLYEMLTGMRPFRSEDLMELVHCHIARLAEPPDALNSAVPKPLSRIVLKLMAKNAEARYQSALVLRAELQRRLDTARGLPPSVEPSAPPDVARYLNIPEKLFGRESELDRLRSAFAETQQGVVRMVLISGPAGVGKTRLVKELHGLITAQRGDFAEGKFGQLKRDVPYVAFVQAFRQLLNHVLMQPENILDIWRQRLQGAVGPNGGLITGLIPEFSSILGPQTPVPELSSTESRNRFKVVFQSLVGTFAALEHPLVLFLDDLQWADGATFDLLESLVGSSEIGYLLLVGAYRNNEVDLDHRLIRMLQEGSSSPVALAEQVELAPLRVGDVQSLVAETLGFSPDLAAPLAELLHKRTGGNPLFVGEYLRLLYTEGVLTFDEHSGWSWDPLEADRKYPVEGIGDLIRSRLSTLSPRTQDVLNLAACVGERFTLRFLAELEGVPAEAIEESLSEAIREDLIQTVAYVVGGTADALAIGEEYRFCHDQIHSTVYQLMPEVRRLDRHRKIGEALLRAGAAEQGGDALFDVLFHLNRIGADTMDQAGRDDMAASNLRAARSAKTSAAFEQCLRYAQRGLLFVRAEGSSVGQGAGLRPGAHPVRITPPWERQYQLTYDLCLEAAQAAYWNLEFDLMNELLAEILAHARSLLDRVRAHEVHTMAYISRGQLGEGIRTGLMALSQLGVSFPERPRQRHVALGYMRTRLALLGKSPEDLRNLAPIQSEELLAVFRILREMDAALFLSRPDLFPLTVFKQVQLSLQHGNTAESAAAYCTFGLVLGGVMGNFELGTRFGRLALDVLEDFGSRELYPRVHFLNNYFIRPWKEPFSHVLDSMLEAHQVAIQAGDFEYGAYLLDLHLACSYHSGVSLAELDELAERHVQKISQLGQERTLRIVEMRYQAIRSLIEPADEPWRMIGSVCNCEALQGTLVAAGDSHGECDFLVNRLILCYQFYRYEEAYRCLEGIESRFGSLAGEILVPLYYFYCPLVHIARYADLEPRRRRASRKKIRHCRKQLEKWAASAPSNYAHKRLLVEAVWAEHQARHEIARELYDQAITLAEQSGYTHELGLANELAGAFHLRRGHEGLAAHYLGDARYAYELWGAGRRTEALIEKYPELAIQRSKLPKERSATSTFTSTSETNVSLDSLSVIKSSQAISGEIQLDRLLSDIMWIVLENAGAQRGALLLEHQGAWFIEAVGSTEEQEVKAERHIPLDARSNAGFLPVSLVRLVIRTKQEIVVDDLRVDRRFDSDPYISTVRPESMLCLPFLRQGQLAGVLYLENRTTSHAFTRERLELLSVLCAQAAISIENARLFSNLDSLMESQKRFVPDQFLKIMHRADIRDVHVGDYVARTMSVLFCDLRQFTPLAEQLAPDVTIELLNLYFGAMEAPIREHGGFIDAFTGDEIMVLFDGAADDALNAAISMFHALDELNQRLKESHGIKLSMGVGINTGRLLLGTVGGQERIKCGVVGDTVNLASRIESLTKEYQARILIGEETRESLERPECFHIRELERVKARGKSKEVTIFEVLVE